MFPRQLWARSLLYAPYCWKIQLVSHFLHIGPFSSDKDDIRAMARIYFEIMGGERKRALWHLTCQMRKLLGKPTLCIKSRCTLLCLTRLSACRQTHFCICNSNHPPAELSSFTSCAFANALHSQMLDQVVVAGTLDTWPRKKLIRDVSQIKQIILCVKRIVAVCDGELI